MEPAAEGDGGAPASAGTAGQRKPMRGRTTFAGQARDQAAVAPQSAAATEEADERDGAQAGGRATGGRGRKKVQFAELEEADLFEGGGAAAGRDAGGPGGALVETERDRLIRLVGAAGGCWGG